MRELHCTEKHRGGPPLSIGGPRKASYPVTMEFERPEEKRTILRFIDPQTPIVASFSTHFQHSPDHRRYAESAPVAILLPLGLYAMVRMGFTPCPER